MNSSATNAVNLAVQNIRYTPLLYTSVNSTTTDLTLNASPPNYCWGSGRIPGVQHERVLQHVWNPTSANTRQVTVSRLSRRANRPGDRHRLVDGRADQLPAAASAAGHRHLRRLPPTGVSATEPRPVRRVLRQRHDHQHWNWTPTVPTVTGVVGASPGTFDGGQPITITGSGFTAGATVNFVNFDPLAQVQSTPDPPSADRPGHERQRERRPPRRSPRTSPAVTTLANYYITVTTPGGGTSLVNSRVALFVYSRSPRPSRASHRPRATPPTAPRSPSPGADSSTAPPSPWPGERRIGLAR